MNLEILEKNKNKLKIAVNGETHTILNILRENCWKSEADQATYLIEHPYLSQPQIIVRSKNPKKTLKDAATLTENQAKEFKKEFEKALKK